MQLLIVLPNIKLFLKGQNASTDAFIALSFLSMLLSSMNNREACSLLYLAYTAGFVLYLHFQRTLWIKVRLSELQVKNLNDFKERRI